MSLWDTIMRKRAEEWTYGDLSPARVPGGAPSSAVMPDCGYLNVFLKSLRIVHVRKGLNKFYGAAHSYASLPHLTGDRAGFHVLVAPSELANIDAKNINRVLQMNRRLLGPVPYRGGDLDLELGLFSIRSADYAAPFMGLLEEVAATAGVAFVKSALPFAAPLQKGFNLLAGTDGVDVLEVGVSVTYHAPQSGTFVVLRAPKGSIRVADLGLDKDYRLVDLSGAPLLDYPYLVFSIESDPTRPDWFQIPELASAHSDLREEVRKGDYEGAEESFSSFKRTTLTSPDLLSRDATSIVSKVYEELKDFLVSARTAGGAPTATIRSLEEIDLYRN